MSDGAPAVAVRELSISLGAKGAKTEVLSGVSFTVPRGAFVSIVGRNGAGKSTIFRCVTGLASGWRGSIELAGVSARGLAPRERARLLAYVPQSAPSDVPFTVGEFMEMSRYAWRGRNPEADRKAAADAMELAGVAPLAGRRLDEISGGERQRVMIASAVAQGAPCVLMDEPTTYLDYASQAEAMRIMRGMNQKLGTSMLVVTHDINMALRLSTSIVAIEAGRVAWAGTPREFESDGAAETRARLEGIYGVRFDSYRAEGCGMPMLAPALEAV